MPSADSRESRSLCDSRGGTKTFPLEELWVPVDKEGSVVCAQAVFICLCTVGINGAAEARSFHTTSGGCINSHAQRDIKGREIFHPMIKILSLNEVCVITGA